MDTDSTKKYFSGITQDPRLRVLAILLAFLLIGIFFLGFDKSPQQIAFMIGFSCLLDMCFHYMTKETSRLLLPISAAITGTGLSILTHFPHTIWLGAVPVFLAISSKYVLTYQSKHIFNPGLFGLTLCLLFSDGMIAAAPVSQWGGLVAFCILILFMAASFFLFNIKRQILTAVFLAGYFLQVLLRGFTIDADIPLTMLLMGVLQSPAFYLFTFFMLTDPRTSPDTAKGQVFMALWVIAADFIFHSLHFTFTLFYAGFSYFTARFLSLHFLRSVEASPPVYQRIFYKWREITLCLALLWLGVRGFDYIRPVALPPHPGFTLTALPSQHTGISGEASPLLQQTDPRIAHLAKWFYAMGDAAAVADVNHDGLPDLFLTQPLKAPQDRANLYLNQGDFQFKKFPLPALDDLRQSPDKYGSPTQGLWVDYDNDGDQDLFLTVFWGHPYLLKNNLQETGELSFEDVSAAAGFTAYINSAAANVADLNRDGLPDIILAGSLPLYVSDGDYSPPEYFNIFQLPKAAYEGDRRPFNVMRRNPYDARNAGSNMIYLAAPDGKFRLLDNKEWGFQDEKRWTLDIAVGDVNNDGWDDIYFANTAGPDRLYLNKEGRGFTQIQSYFKDGIGQDTYRGMNASFLDADKNGFLDIYVSNMHKAELPEGSLLWMNDGRITTNKSQAFKNKAFAKNIINPDRFSWGAATVDIDLDGDMDILQTAGWLDSDYDSPSEPTAQAACGNYVYKLFQIEASPPATHGYIDNWPDMRGECLYPRDPKRVFLNSGRGFIDVADAVGWGKAENSRAIAAADFDNDGDKDIVVTHMTAPPSLYRNDLAAPPHWVGLLLKGNGTSCATNAFGTRAVLQQADNKQEKRLYASNGLSSQHDPRITFALTDQAETATLDIFWCGNKKPERVTVKAGAYHLITQQAGNNAP
ncbi:MAG: hypothetical protein HND56_05265 [Pseudomonadota bacterium]|nr:hypothetical protein [Pseudomonadota bacterium]QKK05132.1 MAG: hypothetical protein HND56_05265 [Pseudomonadota bacterium]